VYTSTLTATKHHPAIEACFEQLIAAGKPYRVTMTCVHAQAAHHPDRHSEDESS
jgi:hypothetical protein